MRPAVDFDEVPARFVRGSAWGSVAAVCVDGRALALEGGGALVLGIGTSFGPHPRSGPAS
eukprot:1205833-Pyramimonas_sp.AAC.1